MYPDIVLLKHKLFDPYQVTFGGYIQEPESSAYSACRFSLGHQLVVFRSAKLTPKKAGLFVTLWKRDMAGITIPFDENDAADLVMIFAKGINQMGAFIFPKAVLIEKKIFSTQTVEGKRGFRVYPPWDSTTSKQAKQTQEWQGNYFMEFNSGYPVDQRLLVNLGFGRSLFPI